MAVERTPRRPRDGRLAREHVLGQHILRATEAVSGRRRRGELAGKRIDEADVLVPHLQFLLAHPPPDGRRRTLMLSASSAPSGWVRSADFDDHRAAERLAALHRQGRARLDRLLREVAQHRCVAVGDAGEDPLLAGIQVRERNRFVGGDRQIAIRDRIAVWIEVRLAELGRDQLLQLFGDVVLEDLCLLVDPVPGHAEDLREEELDQPVVADHLERDALPLGGQAGAVVGRVLDDALVGEAPEHARGRRGRHAKPLRDG